MITRTARARLVRRFAALVVPALALGLLAVPSASAAPSPATGPTPGSIQALVDSFLAGNDTEGIAAAVVTPSGASGYQTQYFFAGKPTIGKELPVTALTQFELASESKTFTAGLLATMIAQGKIRLTDPVKNYVPAGVHVPEWQDNGVVTPITIGDLATHQSGLADEPANLNAGCPDQKPCPQAKQNYTEAMLWDGLANAKLLWAPGTTWLYSNWAFGILGTILANLWQPAAASPPYGPAVQALLAKPLQLMWTQLETQTSKLATPYSGGVQVPYWNNTNALAGGGGLISNISDMGRWIAANLGYRVGFPTAVASTLAPVAHIKKQCSAPDDCHFADFDMGMSWQLYQLGALGVPYATKNGGSSGMHSVTYLVPGSKLGVTVLSNGGAYVDSLGAAIAKAYLPELSRTRPIVSGTNAEGRPVGFVGGPSTCG